MNENKIKELVSTKLLGNISDYEIANVLRDVLFKDNQIDWQACYKSMLEHMPELRLKTEINEKDKTPLEILKNDMENGIYIEYDNVSSWYNGYLSKDTDDKGNHMLYTFGEDDNTLSLNFVTIPPKVYDTLTQYIEYTDDMFPGNFSKPKKEYIDLNNDSYFGKEGQTLADYLWNDEIKGSDQKEYAYGTNEVIALINKNDVVAEFIKSLGERDTNIIDVIKDVMESVAYNVTYGHSTDDVQEWKDDLTECCNRLNIKDIDLSPIEDYLEEWEETK